MIKGIKIKDLRSFEFCQFLEDVLMVVRQDDPAKLDVQEDYDTLLILQQQAFQLVGKTTKSLLTTELDAIDLRRDKAYWGIRGVVEAMTNHYDEIIVQHAKRLLEHLSYFGSVDQENNLSEIVSIRSLLSQWADRQPLSEAITALGLNDWKSELEAANTAYEERKLDKVIIIGTASKDKFSDKRGQATQAYFALRNRLNSACVVYKAAEPYQKIINTINELIRKYKEVLTKRKEKSE